MPAASLAVTLLELRKVSTRALNLTQSCLHFVLWPKHERFDYFFGQHTQTSTTVNGALRTCARPALSSIEAYPSSGNEIH